MIYVNAKDFSLKKQSKSLSSKTDRKSTYGHTLLIGNGAVVWASKKQRTISTSTTEAEYVDTMEFGGAEVYITS